LLIHAVFSTFDRVPFLSEAIRSDVHAYIGGILRELRATPIAVGGTSDHVHLLTHIPAEMAVADCLRIVKTNSSRWLKQKWPERRAFAWQRGYGAFSVSESGRAAVIRYIQDQEHHHRRISFREEFLVLLKKHGIEFEEKYLWR
jgi:REP element-mobilizing transposase RayT